MTDNDIIKALECCSYEGGDIISCIECPEYKFNNILCIKDVMNKALDLINRQKAEIERLQKANESFSCLGKLYSEIKTEAIKEFAERLKEHTTTARFEQGKYSYKIITAQSIDNLVKEMTEVNNESTS